MRHSRFHTCHSFKFVIAANKLLLVPMSDVLGLNCLVFGESRNSVFPVKIPSTETVGTLKEAIKDKKRPLFDSVPADTLILWKVSVLFEKNLEESLEKFNPDDTRPLSPWIKLCKIQLKSRYICFICFPLYCLTFDIPFLKYWGMGAESLPWNVHRSHSHLSPSDTFQPYGLWRCPYRVGVTFKEKWKSGLPWILADVRHV